MPQKGWKVVESRLEQLDVFDVLILWWSFGHWFRGLLWSAFCDEGWQPQEAWEGLLSWFKDTALSRWPTASSEDVVNRLQFLCQPKSLGSYRIVTRHPWHPYLMLLSFPCQHLQELHALRLLIMEDLAVKGLRPDKRSLAGGGYRTMGSSCAWICDDMICVYCILYTVLCIFLV